MAAFAGDYQNSIPVGQLGILPLPGTEDLARRIDAYIVSWRRDHAAKLPPDDIFHRWAKESYIIQADFFRFGTGEGKTIINQSVRGYDLFLLCDCYNYGVSYEMRGQSVPMGPDEHFANLKRAISAAGGRERRLTVIMPMLYEGRQHRRSGRESLDCSMALQELKNMGVKNIVTFDAHDARVQNAIPNAGFENVPSIYQMIKALLNTVQDLNISKDHLMIVSPDEGGMHRCVEYAHMLEVDLGMFYKRRDYSRIVKGRNPIVAHMFLGDNVDGKDVIVVDDMISSGDSLLDVADQLKQRGAQRIFFCAAFGLFDHGLARIDKAYADGLFDIIFTANMIYTPQELLARPWYASVDMSKYISYIIDTINFDDSLSSILSPGERIRRLLVEKGYRLG